MLCYITCHFMLYDIFLEWNMLYNMCHVMSYNICHVMLYNMCCLILYNMCHVKSYNMSCSVI